MNTKIVFMGSPDFALPTLQALADNFLVTGVVTQPDRPSGRGRKITPPPVKVLARDLRLPVIQPHRLSKPEAMEHLRDWQPDLIVVAAFGQILRSAVLDLPAHGCINVHASLLPRYRGASPIQAAILKGDSQTGVTIMRMDSGVDTGPILSQRAIPILPEDTAGSMSERLSQLGADLLVETLPAYLKGNLLPQAQDEGLATHAPMLKKEDGRLDFRYPAEELARRVRAFNPWPGAYTTWQGQRLKIHNAHAVDHPQPETGAVTVYQDMPALGTSNGLLILDEIQPAGKKLMNGKVFLRGARGWVTD